MALLGYNILVFKGSTAIAGVKTNEIDSGAYRIEISSATDQYWRHFIAGRKEWSINVSYLVLDASALAISGKNGIQDLLQVGNTFTLRVKKRGAANSAGVSGTAILTACKIGAIMGNLATGTFQFTGTGPLA